MPDQERYMQDTEFALLGILSRALDHKTFVDIGAEKGSFARFLMQQGLPGVLFEPCPKHHDTLTALTTHTNTRFLPYAIDSRDRMADLHLSFDENGTLQDYFHSLHPLPDDPKVRHRGKASVVCRSLDSLVEEGLVAPSIGLLKMDTEGNDLNVLKGMGRLQAEVLICEFFTEGLYAGWEDAHPKRLIMAAEKLGFTRYLAIKKQQGRELLSWNPATFSQKQWGNLVFMQEAIYQRCFDALQALVADRESLLLAAPSSPQAPPPSQGLPQSALASLESWLAHQLNQPTALQGTVLLDVGAYHGTFARSLLDNTGFEQAILFEPNPQNLALLEQASAEEPRLTVEPLALGADIAEVTLNCTDDPATGSVLSYTSTSLASGQPVARYAVQQTTLDHYLAGRKEAAQIGLIKIDTQGYDLHVLEGAAQTLQKAHPWIVVELIFGPLYQNQAEPIAIFNWLDERGYRLAALFNAHYAETPWLAFADAVFVPPTVDRHYAAPYYATPNLAALQDKVQALQTICDERLALINYLHEEAAQRLAVIQQLEKELQAQKGTT